MTEDMKDSLSISVFKNLFNLFLFIYTTIFYLQSFYKHFIYKHTAITTRYHLQEMKIIHILFIIFAIVSYTIAQQTQICGDSTESCSWSFDETNQTLKITGTGAMTNFVSAEEIPWKEYKEKISKIEIQEGITSIGNYCFNGLTTAQSITIPASVLSIGSNPFINCSSLQEIVLINSTKYEFTNGMLIENKNKLISYLQTKEIEEVILPSNIITIGTYAISNNKFMKTLVMKKLTTTIEQFGITNCSELTTIYHYATGPTIAENGLVNCPKIEHIFVPPTFTGEYKNYNVTNPNGTCGTTAYYYFTEESGLFIIYGIGPTTNFTAGANTWQEYRNTIKKIKIVDGITTIGERFFFYNVEADYGLLIGLS